MPTEPIITNERVDDIPVLLTQIEHMGVQKLLDKHFPTHGNWQGESLGQVAVIWLTHIILSQADHRLNHVQTWASKRLETLKTFVGEGLGELDLTDDPLEAVLRYFDSDSNWYSFEEELGSSLLQVYEIQPQRVRLDSTTASSHCGVNPEGLFQWGHSKDHRPDLAQVKIMLSTLDPLGMPIATEILSGEKADDPLYIPAIERVRSTLKQSGLLYIGDCKMASMGTRTHIVLGGDFYLCPLNAKLAPREQLAEYLQPVWDEKQELTTIDYDYADGKTRDIAVRGASRREGFELKFLQKVEIDEQEIFWEERQLVVHSFAIAQTEEKYLRERIQKTSDALAQLKIPRRGKKRLTSSDQWESAIADILKRYQTNGLFQIDIQTKRVQKVKRRYLERAFQTVEGISFYPDFKIDEDAVLREIQLLGWRVYVTNQNQAQLSLKQAVRTYRDEYLTERGFARLKGFPLSLTPIYLQREDHVINLIRLLSNGKASVDPFRISGSSPSGEKSRKACWTLCWQS
ncbi:transposase [uncultured Nostoc sp.]|uniref:IS1634 family transposase n=1 Tax=uncultured Nostoc sp. TaxID=340711 RepID=UPI0035CB0F24